MRRQVEMGGLGIGRWAGHERKLGVGEVPVLDVHEVNRLYEGESTLVTARANEVD